MKEVFTNEDLISSYTREQALADGFLVDVSQTSKEAGIRFPVALTRRVFDDCVCWQENDAAQSQFPQDESGRLWDVVWLLRHAMLSAPAGESAVTYRISRIPRPGCGKLKEVRLRALVHPGDCGEPVITVMFPDED